MHETIVDALERNEDHAAAFASRFDDVQERQAPAAVTVCCSDSRVLQDAMWVEEQPGHLFTVGNIGNRVRQRTEDGDVVSGDVLYPLVHTDTELVIVVGHTGCGAVTAAYDYLANGIEDGPAGIQHCLDLLASGLEAGLKQLPADLERTDAIDHLVEYNVDRQVDALLESDDVPPGTSVLGVVYDFQDVYSGDRGEVHVVNLDGERSVEALRSEYEEIADRVERQWEY